MKINYKKMIKKMALAQRWVQLHLAHLSPALRGIIFAGFFAGAFSIFAMTASYLPIKFPAAIPFLVAGQDSTIVDDDTAVVISPLDSGYVGDLSMAYSQKLTDLDKKIRSAGIPIDGAALISRDTHETRIDFKKEATEEQKLQAKQIADEFDWTITYGDIFNPEKTKQAIIDRYSVNQLVAFSSYLPIINSFLSQKNFTKLKGFMNSLYAQKIISQDDYIVLANILSDQNIYFNLNFGGVPPAKPAESVASLAPTTSPSSFNAPEPPTEAPKENSLQSTAPVENAIALPSTDMHQEVSPSSAPVFVPNAGLSATQDQTKESSASIQSGSEAQPQNPLTALLPPTPLLPPPPAPVLVSQDASPVAPVLVSEPALAPSPPPASPPPASVPIDQSNSVQ